MLEAAATEPKPTSTTAMCLTSSPTEPADLALKPPYVQPRGKARSRP